MLRTAIVFSVGVLTIAPGRLDAGDLILNEYNAVRAGRWLQCDGPNCCCPQPTCAGGSQPDKACAQDTECPGVYSCTADGGNTFTNQLCNPANLDGDCTLLDPSWTCKEQRHDVSCACDPPCKGDSFFGRVQGNGGNWIELVVTRNHLDIRGWQLAWTEDPADSGKLTLTNHPLWSDLRAGTIITFAELDTAAGGLSTDASYDPAGGDWWININTLSSGGGPQTDFVTTVTNVTGDGPGNFSVGNGNWQLTILDAAANVVFGPCGEGIPLSGPGVNDREVFKLEEDPTPTIDPISSNYRDGTSSSFGGPNLWSDGDQWQDFTCLRCNDGAFCNGAEVCDANRECRPGSEPCSDRAHCDEAADRCVQCVAAAECDDADPCTENSCLGGTCRFSRIAGCGEDGGGGGTTPPGSGDADSDGVPDDADACADTPPLEAVDADGCGCSQLDGDNDGVRDCDDACPGTLADEARDETGCACRQLDDDEDGVENCTDTCSETPSSTTVDAEGCSCLQRDPSGDKDRDGILNCFDQCPETVFGQEADAQGCSCAQLDPDSDEDGDGAADCLDECAHTPPAQTVDDAGCPVDQPAEPVPGEEVPGDDGGSAGSADGGADGESPSVAGGSRTCGALGMINLAFLLCGLLVLRLGRRKSR